MFMIDRVVLIVLDHIHQIMVLEREHAVIIEQG